MLVKNGEGKPDSSRILNGWLIGFAPQFTEIGDLRVGEAGAVVADKGGRLVVVPLENVRLLGLGLLS